MDIRIKPVSATHISALIRIADETNLSPWSAQNYLDELRTESSVMLCAEAEANDVLGFIVGRIVPSALSLDEQDAEIYNLAIVEKHQRRGLGQTLFDAFSEQCRAASVGNIWLEVRSSNKKAIDFYSKNGFEPVQTRPNFYENPREHAILMQLSLKKRIT